MNYRNSAFGRQFLKCASLRISCIRKELQDQRQAAILLLLPSSRQFLATAVFGTFEADSSDVVLQCALSRRFRQKIHVDYYVDIGGSGMRGHDWRAVLDEVTWYKPADEKMELLQGPKRRMSVTSNRSRTWGTYSS